MSHMRALSIIRSRLRLLWVLLGTYACMWLVTAMIGAPQLRHQEISKMTIPANAADISPTSPFAWGNVRSTRRKPGYWCVARAYAPFLVRVDSGESTTWYAHGARTWYVWMFGYSMALGGVIWAT